VFAYRTPADTRTHFVLANLAGADGPDGVLSAIDRALAAPKNGAHSSLLLGLHGHH